MYSNSELLLNNTYLRADLKFNKYKLVFNELYAMCGDRELCNFEKKINFKISKNAKRPWFLYSN